MVPSYLLDTNMVSALITRPRGAVANRVRGVGEVQSVPASLWPESCATVPLRKARRG